MIKDFSDLFEAYAKMVNLKEIDANKIVFFILLTGFIITVVTTLYNGLKKVILFFKRFKSNKDLHPFFTNKEVRNATKFYISTKYQNISPSEDEEPSRRYIASAKDELMPLFLNKVFPPGKNDNKYYLILADSGMGKTTFLINLYLRYRNKFTTIFQMKPYDIKLIPIWHSEALNYISEIKEPENTILLLDAFDENISAQNDYFRTLKNILLKVSKFRVIVMTCRTQFFPSQKEEPHETGYFTAGDNGEFYFQKLYLSAFDEKDVKKYLKNKFSFIWQMQKYKKANQIVNKCPNLVIRPMLLNHIEDLLGKDKLYDFSFQVYEELINSWIRREARKSGIKEKYESEQQFFRILLRTSQFLAINLYENREKRGGYFISRNEKFEENIIDLDDLDDGDEDSLDEKDTKTRSLLTRNAVGDYKFSHKSILEYFLANAFFTKRLDFGSFDFFGMDLVKKFHNEMLIHKLRLKDGNFAYSSNGFLASEKTLPLIEIKLEKIKDVQYLEVKDFTSIKPEQLSVFNNLKKLVLIDEKEMKVIYELYLQLDDYFEHLRIQIENQNIPKYGKQKWESKFTELEHLGFNVLKNHLENLGYKEIKRLDKYLSFKNLNIGLANDEFGNSLLLNRENINIKRINKNIEQIMGLKKRLPTCEIFF